MARKKFKTKKITFKVSEIPLTRRELKSLLNYRIPCICCGREMIPPDVYTQLERMDLTGTALEVVEILKPFENIMFPVEKQVYHMLKDMAVKYPDKNFQDLLMMKRDIHELALVRIQSVIFNKISFYRRILPSKIAHKLRNLMIKTNDTIFNPAPKKAFSRRMFIIKLKGILKNFNNEKMKEEIIKIARRLPRSSDEVCAFVVKNARKRPEVIALNLIHPAVGTFEHLQPRSQNGLNNSLNFALECSYCNSSRHHYPLSVQLEENPDMPHNAQVHAEKLISLCKKGIGKKEYIENLCHVLACLSENEINIDLSLLNDKCYKDLI